LVRSLHDTSIRQRVRRAERDGLTFRLAGAESELRRFYQLLVEVRRGEGLPSPPYAFFANMQRLLSPGNLFELAVVESSGRIVAAAVVLKGRSTRHLEYSASDARFLKHGANQLLIWECIKRAHQEKATHFDFGRTSLWHRSLLEFKDRWHADRHPIRYRYFPDTIKPPQWHDISNSFLIRLNKKLPAAFLQLEGRIIYPHRG
jgi:lipid II:glycine glycyltransferase (peptidoglycan interpeptide bridge formation enzyme)